MDIGDLWGNLLGLFVYAWINNDRYYASRAQYFAQAMGVNSPIVVVAGIDSTRYQWCGVACSIGIGSAGIVLVDKRILGSNIVPEELKEFIIAHEVAHIVRGHAVESLILRTLTEASLTFTAEAYEALGKARDLVDLLTGFLASLTATIVLIRFAEVDLQTVKRQELEADDVAIKLAGCKGALIFAQVLRELKRQGYSVSHESLLGSPALTIDERMKFIQERCRYVLQ